MDFIAKLQEVKNRFDKIMVELSSPDILSDQKRMIELSKKRSELEEVVITFGQYQKVNHDELGNLDIIQNEKDSDIVELAEAELEDLRIKKADLEEKIKFLLIPKDPDDDKNVILEIRAGTGGDEAGLFANDLFRMYTRFCEKIGWKYELIDINDMGGVGGIKEVIMSIAGNGVYGDLKFESGVHRVQRVPATEASGRLHTSAASVAVMPEAEDVQVDVDRSGGAGGQNVNKVETAIRITHIPTGIVVQCQDERSQLKNRQKAMKVLNARLYDAKLQEHNKEIADQRKSMVKSGDRSDKIRTYNFPQNRLTDHRIGLTLYSLSTIMDGDLEEIIEKLKLADRTEKLKTED
jgi:peptide chain release factor 1